MKNKRYAISAVVLLTLASFAMCIVPSADASTNPFEPTILPSGKVNEYYTVDLANYWHEDYTDHLINPSDTQWTFVSVTTKPEADPSWVSISPTKTTSNGLPAVKDGKLEVYGTPNQAGEVTISLKLAEIHIQNTLVHLHYKFTVDEAIPHTVTFDSKGGSYIAPKQVIAGDSYGTLPTPTKSGYTFTGWYDGAIKVSTSSIPTKDTTLVANWSANVIQYTAPSTANKQLAVGTSWNHNVSSTSSVAVSIDGASWMRSNGSVLSGTPTDAGTYTVNLTLTAPNYVSKNVSFTLTIVPQLELTNSPTNGAIAYVLM